MGDLPELERRLSEASCAKCGEAGPIDWLDAKPSMTWWLWIVRLFIGQERMLSYAAAHGYDFHRLECPECYGHGYTLIRALATQEPTNAD